MSSLELSAFHAWLSVGEVPPSLDRWISGRVRSIPDRERRREEGARIWAFLNEAVAWGTLATARRLGGRRFVDEVRRPRDLFRLWRAEDESFVKRVFDRSPIPGESLAVRCINAGVPPWHGPMIGRREGAWVAAWLAMQGSRPPLWARGDAEALRAEGYTVDEVEGALKVQGSQGIFASKAFEDGKVEVQDLGSQRVGARVDLQPGQFGWDACAGLGGKTLQMAGKLAGKGALYASDVDAKRLQTLKLRARRAHVEGLRFQPWDGEKLPEWPLEVQKREGFHSVLVDAPCSGSGTWRRNPDARVRLVPGGKWGQVQSKLLQVCSGAVRPGGQLLYATCSVDVGENEDVVAAFLAQNPAFTLEHQGMEGAPEVDADTLFAASLRRRA